MKIRVFFPIDFCMFWCTDVPLIPFIKGGARRCRPEGIWFGKLPRISPSSRRRSASRKTTCDNHAPLWLQSGAVRPKFKTKYAGHMAFIEFMNFLVDSGVGLVGWIPGWNLLDFFRSQCTNALIDSQVRGFCHQATGFSLQHPGLTTGYSP